MFVGEEKNLSYQKMKRKDAEKVKRDDVDI